MLSICLLHPASEPKHTNISSTPRLPAEIPRIERTHNLRGHPAISLLMHESCHPVDAN
ncbi:hypothetical protein CCHR01_06370 [Colletotrichum chrysophilum]|uniref:Uncharacterized protein n=1 Tax=Colletotrichum chrysophilum TaxID=1836956 RepID=A0AAD9ENG6_9PEZI|nr:hypothetical protein CCHR01_06370 [Colletotrichum chrysophilum]